MKHKRYIKLPNEGWIRMEGQLNMFDLGDNERELLKRIVDAMDEYEMKKTAMESEKR